MGRGGTDERVFNEGIISEWFNRRPEHSAFLSLLRPGDLVEFQREGYQHWAVYIGEHALAEDTEEPDDSIIVTHCIVHRANPTDNMDEVHGFLSASKSLSKGAHGIGDVVVEPLEDVWGESRARVNNSMDNSRTPYPSHQVVVRALSVVHGEDRQAYTPYNVLTNNCEHFVCWCRNGWAVSCQVANKTVQLGKLAAFAGALMLPRPLAVLSAACVAGYNILSEVRRSAHQHLEASQSPGQITDLAQLQDSPNSRDSQDSSNTVEPERLPLTNPGSAEDPLDPSSRYSQPSRTPPLD